MNVSQYARSKYGTRNPSSILNMEAIIFGIPLPLGVKWLNSYGKITITEDMKLLLSTYLLSNKDKPHSIKAIKILGIKLTPEDQASLDAIKKEDEYIKRVYGNKKVYRETMAASKLKELWR